MLRCLRLPLHFQILPVSLQALCPARLPRFCLTRLQSRLQQPPEPQPGCRLILSFLVLQREQARPEKQRMRATKAGASKSELNEQQAGAAGG